MLKFERHKDIILRSRNKLARFTKFTLNCIQIYEMSSLRAFNNISISSQKYSRKLNLFIMFVKW